MKGLSTQSDSMFTNQHCEGESWLQNLRKQAFSIKHKQSDYRKYIFSFSIQTDTIFNVLNE